MRLDIRWTLLGVLLVVAGCGRSANDAISHQFHHDEHGRLDRSVSAGGSVATTTYKEDPSGLVREVQISRADETVRLDFDEHGRIVASHDGMGEVQFEYDGFNRLLSVGRKNLPKLSYAYEASGRISSMAIGSSWRADYSYDFLGRPTKVQTPLGAIEYSYATLADGTSQITRKLPNGVQSAWKYYPSGNLATIQHTSVSGDALLAFAYEYGSSGLIKQISESGSSGIQSTTRYEYDNVGRLIAETGNGGTTKYAYDELGNRTTCQRPGSKPSTAKYDWAGRLVELDGKPCTFDAAGNVTTCPDVDGAQQLTYTSIGALATAAIGTETIRYQYDAEGRLLSRSAGGSTSTFIADPHSEAWQPLASIHDSGKRTYYLWAANAICASAGYGSTSYYLTDHQGSVRCVLDNAGRVTRTSHYDAFGSPQARTPNKEDRFTAGFASMFYDAKIGAYVTLARTYNSSLGRFLQPDPEHRLLLGSQHDLSEFAYCGNDPINYIDISGARSRVAQWVTQGKEAVQRVGSDSAEFWADLAVQGNTAEKVAANILGPVAASLTDLDKVYEWAKLPIYASPAGALNLLGAQSVYQAGVIADPESTEQETTEASHEFAEGAGKYLFLKGVVTKLAPAARLEYGRNNALSQAAQDARSLAQATLVVDDFNDRYDNVTNLYNQLDSTFGSSSDPPVAYDPPPEPPVIDQNNQALGSSSPSVYDQLNQVGNSPVSVYPSDDATDRSTSPLGPQYNHQTGQQVSGGPAPYTVFDTPPDQADTGGNAPVQTISFDENAPRGGYPEPVTSAACTWPVPEPHSIIWADCAE